MNRHALMLFAFGALTAASAEDLSKYRDFPFGAGVVTIAKKAGMDPSEAKVLHSRPALIQELAWRPQPLGATSRTEPVREVVFSFYNGELYRIEVSYDRRETEGLTADDLADVISGTYGTFTRPAVPAADLAISYGEREKVVAQWQDSQYRFNLIAASYGPEFKLAGVWKRLEDPAQAAKLEAVRLDDKEAPQREAARLTQQNDAERIRLEQARLVNKPKFRP
jgi:hypothetical protein